ncbi:MAG TPA: hypothetical protein VNM37_13640, partial [Candidatus Dormibacteraeota bacterium]|nr:hypothetical protein [Candidatus Dormibacteraeota bacterium]
MKRNHEDAGTTATMNPPKGAQMTMDKEEMLKKAETAGRPGSGHKALEHFVGSWKAEVKCW